MKQLYVLALLLAFAAGSLAAQTPSLSLNMTLFDTVNPVDTAGAHAALWGYVAPDGREYALFGSQIGTFIYDITEKPLKEVAFIPGPRNPWREIKVYRQYAYIASEATDGGGLQIIDLSGLPNTANLVRTDTSYFKSAHTIFVRDHYLYVMGTASTSGANGGAIILDLEPDPLNPRRIGMVNPYYYHDAWVRNDTLLGAAINGQGCDIYDIKDKTSPKHLATITYPGSGTHNAEITADGGYVVTSDEIGLTQKTMKVWDIRDLENITKVAEFTPDPNSIVHNVHVVGRYVLAAWYTAGVRILDMIDPRHPREVGYYDTYPTPTGGFNGVWEVYGFFPSGKIIASDRNTGLYVMEFNGATAGSVSGYVRDAVTNNPMPGVTILVPEIGQTVTSDASGFYYVGGANGSQVTLSTGVFRYMGSSDQVTFSGDQQKDILLTPLTLFTGLITAKTEQGAPIEGFAYAVTPHYASVTVSGAAAQITLPRDTTYMLTIGKWGYRTERIPIAITQDQQPISVTLREGYSDDATLDLGWSLETEGDNATTGRWTRIVPYQTYSGSGWFYPRTQPGGDTTGYVFQTGAPPLNRPINAGDVNNGFTTLTTPSMNLVSMPDPRIIFQRWFAHYYADTLRDTLVVQLSNDDGATWMNAYTEAGNEPNRSSEWKEISISPANFLPLTDRMKMRFRVSDVKGTASIFAAVDNFEVNPGVASSAPDEHAGATGGLILRVAPNPAQGWASLTMYLPVSQRQVRVEVFNALGERYMLLHSGTLPAGEHRFPVHGDLPPGSYLIRATGEGGSMSSTIFQVVR